jgi:Uma2 family endonuclease
MSTVLPFPPVSSPPSPLLLTVADVAALPSELPSGPVRYELDNGRLVIMPPPGYIHGRVECHISGELRNQGELRGFGVALCGEVAIVLWRNPDRVVGADSGFVVNASLPIQLSREGYLETIPDLVAEVRSKNDSQPEIDQKISDYHRAGVRVVWIADPETKTVTAHRKGIPPQVFTVNDTLTVDDVIPGFQMPVQNVFVI